MKPNKTFFNIALLTAALLASFTSLHAAAKPKLNLYTVKYQPITQTLYFHGNIQPIAQVPVTSPTQGVIEKMHFHYGEMVQKGQVLLSVSTQKIMSKLRDAEVSYLKAKEAYEEITNLAHNHGLIQAKNGLLKAQQHLHSAKDTYTENQHLFKLGIVAKNTLTQSEQAYQNAKFSLEEAKLSLQSTQQKDKGVNLISAKVSYLNSKDKYDSLKSQVKTTEVTAPHTGIALKPARDESSDQQSTSTGPRTLSPGVHINYQDVLLNIGDLTGISVQFNVPEVNIDAMHATLPAVITSSAFPGLQMKGSVTSVSAQAADQSGGGYGSGSPTFNAIAAVPHLSAKAKELIRSGMRVTVSVQTSKQSHQLAVPIQAISQNKQKQSFVKLYNPQTKHITDQVVQTGKVMPQRVEILSGLSVGDHVVV